MLRIVPGNHVRMASITSKLWIPDFLVPFFVFSSRLLLRYFIDKSDNNNEVSHGGNATEH